MADSMKGQAMQTPQHLQRVAQQLMATQKPRHSASKYDFVKVSLAYGLLFSARCQHYAANVDGNRHEMKPLVGAQVKVWVGENLVHYYVLSRFLISRMLTVTKIPQMKV